MATAVIRYKSKDGTEWTTELAADTRDLIITQCDYWQQQLGPRVPDSHDRRRVDDTTWARVKREFVSYMRQRHPNESVWQHPAEDIHPMSYAGRFMDEANCRPLSDVWHRFACECGGYEYQQPFYALNPQEWKPRPCL